MSSVDQVSWSIINSNIFKHNYHIYIPLRHSADALDEKADFSSKADAVLLIIKHPRLSHACLLPLSLCSRMWWNTFKAGSIINKVYWDVRYAGDVSRVETLPALVTTMNKQFDFIAIQYSYWKIKQFWAGKSTPPVFF